MLASPEAMMAAGLTFGLVHAMDADHVMAVTALSNQRKSSVFGNIKYCLNWALGHGGMLIVIGLAFFSLGVQVPESVQVFAEASVGVLLIAMGCFCLWRIRQQNFQLRVHRHGDVVHSHWHQKGHQLRPNSREAHAPMMVGMLHGIAGSAPALALVPIIGQAQNDQLAYAITYLLVFSSGVLLAMCLFGMGLGYMQGKLQIFNEKLFQWGRYFIAWGSIVFGGVWLSQAL
mgnify:CR=1 FL=1